MGRHERSALRGLPWIVGLACGRGGFVISDEGGFVPDPDDCDPDDRDSDCDRDDIPDADDPFPTDPERPGTVDRNLVYVHDSGALSTFDTDTLVLELVGSFQFPDFQPGVGITDIAIDRFGVMYATSFAGLFVCDPDTATCWRLADANANAAAVLPVGILDDEDDALVVIEDNVEWTHMRLSAGDVTAVALGTIAAPWMSSGDIVFTPPDATWFTSPTPFDPTSPSAIESIVAIDPRTAAVIGEGIPIPPITAAWGLASVGDVVWIFDAAGAIARFDPATDQTAPAVQTSAAFWGAAAFASR